MLKGVVRALGLSQPWLLRPHSSTFALAALEQGSRRVTRSGRTLITLAIETSCDDTCVAILEKTGLSSARLHFNEKITSDNRVHGGIYPPTATAGHARSLAGLVQKSLAHLPSHGGRPDFVSVTRGPGLSSSLATGLETAKGLAVAWDIPFVAVHHMQAHALTPRLVSALDNDSEQRGEISGGHKPAFPFLSLLVSGGHTLLLHSTSLTDHSILAASNNIAIGDLLDKCARVILPADLIEGTSDVMYGRLLEQYAFPPEEGAYPEAYSYTPPRKRGDEVQLFDSGRGWNLTPPMALSRIMAYEFAGFGGQVRDTVNKLERRDGGMKLQDRKLLAKHTMRLAFEHLASRVIFALQGNGVADGSAAPEAKTLVVSGGVASNRYLMHIMRAILDVRGFGDVEIMAPPPTLCTDNAAMIAWAGMEMFEAGWETELSAVVQKTWPLDSNAGKGSGVLGLDSWKRRSGL